LLLLHRKREPAATADPLTAALLARCQFPPPGARVVCAVSGGADSLALLVLAVAAGCDVTAVHVDHGLRPESPSEAEVVRRAATRFGAAFRSEPARVESGPNLEARARQARYEVLPDGVLTGHTADDQAETVLLNLLRGAGLDGLAGMRSGGRVLRPLLALRHRETVGLCERFGLEVLNDPSNADLTFRRNRIRHELLPLLDAIAERDVASVLARQAALLREDSELLESLAATVDVTDVRSVQDAHPALARRALRAWLSTGHPPDAGAIERVLDVVWGRSRATDVGGGRRVTRNRGRLRLDPAPDREGAR
jgi:tRNA(Ile)-lysidine synthase